MQGLKPNRLCSTLAARLKRLRKNSGLHPKKPFWPGFVTRARLQPGRKRNKTNDRALAPAQSQADHPAHPARVSAASEAVPIYKAHEFNILRGASFSRADANLDAFALACSLSCERWTDSLT
jgi:hypothetical protein